MCTLGLGEEGVRALAAARGTPDTRHRVLCHLHGEIGPDGAGALPPKAELTVKVSFEGEALEEIPMLDLDQSQIDGNTCSLGQGYIPSLGWSTALYTFNAELRDGESVIYQSTEQRQFMVTPESVTKVVSWKTLGVVIGSMVIVIVLTVALVLYHRRDMLRDYLE